MKNKQFLFYTTGIVTIGQILCCAAMVGVFFLLGKYDTSVLLGSVLGGMISIANFFIMSLCASIAADKAAKQDVKGGQALITLSYTGRMAGLFLVLALCASSGMFNLIALAIPLIFTRPILTVAELFNKKGGNNQ